MAVELQQALRAGAETLIALSYVQFKALGAKTLPLLLVACVPRAGRIGHALAWCTGAVLVAAVCATVLPSFRSSAIEVCVALGYYALATVAAFGLSALTRAGVLRKDAFFCLLALVFVFGPAPLMRWLGQVEMLALGWTSMVSAYSCCVETRRASQALSFREFVFFVLVDPTVSFPDRSRPRLVPWREVARRLSIGLSLMVISHLAVLGWRSAHASAQPWLTRAGPALSLTMLALVTFFSIYWMRAGAADIRIALMQSMGKQPPECFNRPFCAVSPTDFWRRWNRWLGDWVKRYLYVPIALALLRRGHTSILGSAAAQSVALILSFGAMGLMHDWLLFGNYGRIDFIYTRVFLFGAIGMILWEALAAALRAMRRVEQSDRWWIQLASRLGAAVYVSVMLAVSGRI